MEGNHAAQEHTALIFSSLWRISLCAGRPNFCWKRTTTTEMILFVVDYVGLHTAYSSRMMCRVTDVWNTSLKWASRGGKLEMPQLFISESLLRASTRTLKHKRLNPRLYRDTFHITDLQSRHKCHRVPLQELCSSITTREVDWIHQRSKIFSFFVRFIDCFPLFLMRSFPWYSELPIFTLYSCFINCILPKDHKVATEYVEIHIRTSLKLEMFLQMSVFWNCCCLFVFSACLTSDPWHQPGFFLQLTRLLLSYNVPNILIIVLLDMYFFQLCDVMV